ncbi:hypothetical protein VNO77_04364 [Canavalia gladiata]|uniref:Arf-GAP domain-containing protein n=1 Tax=Canavalia gladiata TaxID=3824 RepID=A0AAN9R902_CANGL
MLLYVVEASLNPEEKLKQVKRNGADFLSKSSVLTKLEKTSECTLNMAFNGSCCINPWPAVSNWKSNLWAARVATELLKYQGSRTRSKNPQTSRAKQRQIPSLWKPVLEGLPRLRENKEYVDCKAKSPRWTNVNFGIFICIQCSGIHQSLRVIWISNSTGVAKVVSCSDHKLNFMYGHVGQYNESYYFATRLAIYSNRLCVLLLNLGP